MRLTAADQQLVEHAGTFLKTAPKRLGIAVSGGSDSTALLCLLANERSVENHLEVATVNHGLRPEASAEAEFVAGLCAGFGLAHHHLRWAGWDGAGNLQASAREARYRLLADWSQSRSLGGVVLGHTMDDLAETFLMRLARGSGLDGLAAMEATFTRHETRFFRPLLDHRRPDLRAYLKHRDLTWCDDPSNEDDAFERVKARQLLAALSPLGVTESLLARTATELRAPKHALQVATEQLARQCVRQDVADLLIDRDDLAQAPSDLQRRLLSQALKFVAQSAYPPRAEAISNVQDKIAQGGSTTLNGCFVTVRQNLIRIGREYQAVADETVQTTEIWDNRWRFEGPHHPGLRVKALGETGLAQLANWRKSGLPHRSAMACPGIWSDATLIYAPLAESGQPWRAILLSKANEFYSSLLSH